VDYFSSGFNWLAAHTIGVLWSGGSGTVDPWSKEKLIEDETNSLIAGGMDPQSARAQAESDITGSLKASGADPSQANTVGRISGQLAQIGNWLLIAGLIVVAIEVLSFLR
jgi:hypothetical protein